MAKVTPGSIVYTLLLLTAFLLLFQLPVSYYTNSLVANSFNDTTNTVRTAFYNNIYTPEKQATFNATSGLKASSVLQQFTGLAFMFGSMYQEGTSIFTGTGVINTVISFFMQYALLPPVDMVALIGLLVSGVGFSLMWWLITNWTKVEND